MFFWSSPFACSEALANFLTWDTEVEKLFGMPQSDISDILAVTKKLEFSSNNALLYITLPVSVFGVLIFLHSLKNGGGLW